MPFEGHIEHDGKPAEVVPQAGTEQLAALRKRAKETHEAHASPFDKALEAARSLEGIKDAVRVEAEENNGFVLLCDRDIKGSEPRAFPLAEVLEMIDAEAQRLRELADESNAEALADNAFASALKAPSLVPDDRIRTRIAIIQSMPDETGSAEPDHELPRAA